MNSEASVEGLLQQARHAFYATAVLSPEQRNQTLEAFARLIAMHTDRLLEANRLDCNAAQQEGVTSALTQRLKLDPAKISQLMGGIRDLIRLPNPTGRILSRMRLDHELVLEKQTVPLGVIGLIFESRPDVIPQVLSLVLKSGNVAVLKGGREAHHTNKAFMSLVEELNRQCPWLPPGWASLLESREAVHAMLRYPQYVDLIIPRGSNVMIQAIMASTSIPVLGHADGVCHLYIHTGANLEQATRVVLDAKTQYPAACNALETLLVDAAISQSFLLPFADAGRAAGLTLKGCPQTCAILPNIAPMGETGWHVEYGDLTLAIRVVDSLAEAITHINTYGSHHTDGILSMDEEAVECFLASVDSACVFVNASTRFADGFRFGLGAEVGISTSRTHARGPVGLEGLVTYKYKLRGAGHMVADYVGENAKPFLHQPIITT